MAPTYMTTDASCCDVVAEWGYPVHPSGVAWVGESPAAKPASAGAYSGGVRYTNRYLSAGANGIELQQRHGL